MLIYLDSVIVIYFYGSPGSFQARAFRHLMMLRAAGHEAVVSDLVRMECRVGPLRTGNGAELAKLDGFFARPDLRTTPITSAVFDRAADIRARYRFKTPDSIHLAAAIEAGCDRVLTNDARLARFPGRLVEVLP